MSEFKFACSGCGQHIACDDSYAGMSIQCPACQRPMVVPEAQVPALSIPSSASPNMPGARRTGPLRVRAKEGVRIADRETWINLGIGFAIAVVAAVIPMLNFIFGYLWTL